MIVGILPAGWISSCHRQPSESDVVHDHIRLRQHQIVAVASIGVGIGARHVQHAGTAEGGETVGGSSCGGEFSSGRRSTKVISDSCSYADCKVLIKRVGEYLLPSAQTWGLWRPGPPVAAPRAGNRHINLLGHLIPGQALVAQLQDLLCGSGMGRSAAAHGDAGSAKLMAYGRPGNAQLGTDLAQGPTLGVQVGRTRNVHCATLMCRVKGPRQPCAQTV
jgi:hypothetical protein